MEYFSGRGPLIYNPDTQTSQVPLGYPNTGQCGTLLYCSTSMNGMNNAGWIVGTWSDSNNLDHGFVNQGGSFTSIDYLGALGTFAIAINDAGLIAGAYTDSNHNTHGFLYNVQTNLFVAAPLDYPGSAGFTAPLSINGDAQIVGKYSDGANYQGFFYSNGNFMGIPTSCGMEAIVGSINNNGQIIGYYGNTSLGFITYDDGINCSALDYPGNAFTQIFSNNDAGQITGSWWSPGSNLPNGFVAVPQTP